MRQPGYGLMPAGSIARGCRYTLRLNKVNTFLTRSTCFFVSNTLNYNSSNYYGIIIAVLNYT